MFTSKEEAAKSENCLLYPESIFMTEIKYLN